MVHVSVGFACGGLKNEDDDEETEPQLNHNDDNCVDDECDAASWHCRFCH